MIGPAEIEDMRLVLLASDERARLYDAALAPLNRHWERRGAASVGSVSQICELVFARAEDRPFAEWKAVVTEAVEQAGFGIVWNGDAVASLESRG
ncbi:hypothetical protein ABC766_08970 [Methylobacterium fujisawaense]|uniref:hypothetical protein n=1 Tax=Methylobacterium fujisawaense TaxID=107400 RepID=UPI0031F59889